MVLILIQLYDAWPEQRYMGCAYIDANVASKCCSKKSLVYSNDTLSDTESANTGTRKRDRVLRNTAKVCPPEGRKYLEVTYCAGIVVANVEHYVNRDPSNITD